jgi:hypothetical protein
MLQGSIFPPDDVRRSLFRALQLHIPLGFKNNVPAGSKPNAIDAVTAPLHLATNSTSPLHKDEMTLEIWLNLSAFYLRLSHFPYVNPSLETLASLAIDKHAYHSNRKTTENDLLNELALTGFQPISFTGNRLVWLPELCHSRKSADKRSTLRGVVHRPVRFAIIVFPSVTPGILCTSLRSHWSIHRRWSE